MHFFLRSFVRSFLTSFLKSIHHLELMKSLHYLYCWWDANGRRPGASYSMHFFLPSFLPSFLKFRTHKISPLLLTSTFLPRPLSNLQPHRRRWLGVFVLILQISHENTSTGNYQQQFALAFSIIEKE